MPLFHFRTHPGDVVSEPMLLADAEAAWQEARGTFADFARDIAASVEVDAPWSVEVLSEEGTLICRIKVSFEAL